MKLFFLIVVGFFVSGGAFANNFPSEASPRTWYVNLFLLNSEMRYERDSSQQTVDRRPLNLAAGLRKGTSSIILEYAAFSERTGNITLSINRHHQESTFWWKENLIHLELVEFYMGAGLGAYEEKVATRLAGVHGTVDSSGLQEMMGLSAGLQSKVAGFILVSLEGRALAGRNFDPNPQGSFVGRLGVEF